MRHCLSLQHLESTGRFLTGLISTLLNLRNREAHGGRQKWGSGLSVEQSGHTRLLIKFTVLQRHSSWHPKAITMVTSKTTDQDFPGDAVHRNLPASAGDMGLIPSPGRFHMLQSSQAVLQPLKPGHLEPVLHNRSGPLRHNEQEPSAHCN